MRAAIVEAPGHLAIRRVPDQEIGPYQALVRTEACSICNATDTKILHGQLPFVGRDQYPGLLGHESTGTVVEVGPKVRQFQVGDRVLRVWATAPGYHSFWGGFAELGLVTDRAAAQADGIEPLPGPFHAGMQVVPAEIEPGAATQLITLKETLSYLRRCGTAPGRSLLIMGTGPVGLAMCYLARQALGLAPILVLGRREAALERARSFGAEVTVNIQSEDAAAAIRRVVPRGVDVAIDAVGHADLLRLGLSVLAEGGRLGSYGIQAAEAEPLDGLRADPRVYPPSCDESEVHDELLAWVRQGTIDPGRFVTHRLPLERLAEGFELIEARAAVKVVVTL